MRIRHAERADYEASDMKHLGITGAAIVFLASTITAGEDKPASTSLFDGKTLTGWRVIAGKPGAWGVENGNLVSFGEGGGWLGTERKYADFVLTFEFKLTPES